MLHNRLLNGRSTAENIAEALAGFYAGQPLVSVVPFGGQSPMLSANKLAGKDTLEFTVCGHEDQTMITARFDNLGKGASGAAVQNMNLMFGARGHYRTELLTCTAPKAPLGQKCQPPSPLKRQPSGLTKRCSCSKYEFNAWI